MQTLDELVADLVYRYTGEKDHPGDGGPGLIHRLDTLGLRTRQAPDGGHAPPGSRPPTSLEAVSWAQRIKAEAVRLDAELRGSAHVQSWYRALKAIPPGAENAGREREVRAVVARWHGTVLTVLGLRGPSVHFRHALCLVCGQRTVYGRADDDKPRGWCINDACADEDGQPARYDTARLYLVTENLSDPEDSMPDKKQNERAELLRRALQQAEAHESGLSGLFWSLHRAEHPCMDAAQAAAEAVGRLAARLREDQQVPQEERTPQTTP
ncbi:hypothetical protein ACIRJO_02765 [Streptomyces sp. NPDC102394]|uniref:hypothetical protein n=1 Tax=Streptomyces sp. NPDC102394 TaxID=3366167 RepID=UPI0038110880